MRSGTRFLAENSGDVLYPPEIRLHVLRLPESFHREGDGLPPRRDLCPRVLSPGDTNRSPGQRCRASRRFDDGSQVGSRGRIPGGLPHPHERGGAPMVEGSFLPVERRLGQGGRVPRHPVPKSRSAKKPKRGCAKTRKGSGGLPRRPASRASSSTTEKASWM